MLGGGCLRSDPNGGASLTFAISCAAASVAKKLESDRAVHSHYVLRIGSNSYGVNEYWEYYEKSVGGKYRYLGQWSRTFTVAQIPLNKGFYGCLLINVKVKFRYHRGCLGTW